MHRAPAGANMLNTVQNLPRRTHDRLIPLHVGGLKVCGDDDDRADRREGRQRLEAREGGGREEQNRAEIEKARQEGVESGRIRQQMMDRRRLNGAVEKAREEGRTDGFQTGRQVEKISERRRAEEARRKAADSCKACGRPL